MSRGHLCVALLLSLAACKKKPAEDKPPAPPPSGSAVAPTGSAKAPSKPQTLALDKLGLEVDAPGCAEVTTISDHDQSVTPNDPSCEIGFPGAVFTDETRNVGKSLDEDVQLLTSGAAPPEIVRKEKTANGWFIETKGTHGFSYTQRYVVGDKLLTCMVQWIADSPKGDVLRKICASARPKT